MNGVLISAGGSSGGFTQQGSVDWVAMSQSTLTFSVEALARFAKAGVEMITIAMGQVIFSNFKLRPDGQQRFSDEIVSLKAFSSYGKALWFGFGIKHIMRTLSETEQGSACAAMCACLSVSYDPLFSSKVLKALTDQQAAPDTLTPSLPQWNALLSVCAGAINNSTFPKLVQGMSRLFSLPETAQKIYLNEPTSPEALAKALAELGRISNGDVRNVTFLGGVDCGWLAAISQWLLSLSVEVVDEQGHPLYCRSEWASILHDAFGDSIDVLLSPENVPRFAHFLYCGFSEIDDANILNYIDPWGGLSSTTQERQFSYVSFASKRLPELAGLLSVAERKGHSPAFGVMKHRNFPDDLREICKCRNCTAGLPSLDISNHMVCLHRLAAVVFEYIWLLSWLDIDEGIYPSATGLRGLYYKLTPSYTASSIKTIPFEQHLISSAIQLFTGSANIGWSSGQESARCAGGICVYLSSLKNPTTSPQDQLRATVIPGQIERGGLIYESVVDKRLPESSGSLTEISDFLQAYGSNLGLKLVVEETLTSKVLEAYLLISNDPHKQPLEALSGSPYSSSPTSPIEASRMIGPADIRQKILLRLLAPTFDSKKVCLRVLSVYEDGSIEWTGCRSSVKKVLRTNTKKRIQLCSKPNEWILVSESSSDRRVWKDVLYGSSNALLYAIICHPMPRASAQLTSTTCLLWNSCGRDNCFFCK
ncbi:hypothetical protein B7463_g5391, partial [Scytalidium lignicola]